MNSKKTHAKQYLDYMLAVANDRVTRQLGAELDRRGVPLEFWRILNLLAPGEGWSMGDLARSALLSLPTATRIVDRMVSEALVYRAPHADDRRKVLIFVSQKGLLLWREVKESADRYQETIADRYGDTWLEELIDKLGHLAESPPGPEGV